MAAALPTPNDCCNECLNGCTDTVIIIDGGGGSGAKQVFFGHGDPVGVLSGMDSTIANLYYDLDAHGFVSEWNPETLTWD